MAAAAISAAFSYVSAAAASAAYSAATAIGISSATAGTIGAAVSSSIMWVGTANGFGTLMAVGSVVSSLSQKVPQPAGAVVQLDTKLSATPPRTVAFGRTALAGTMLYQAVSGVKKPDDNIRLHRIIGLSVGPISPTKYGGWWRGPTARGVAATSRRRYFARSRAGWRKPRLRVTIMAVVLGRRKDGCLPRSAPLT